MDQRNILDHQFVVAAYTVTWVIQLGYLACLGLKWRREKRECRAQVARRHAEHRRCLGAATRPETRPGSQNSAVCRKLTVRIQ